MALTKLWNTFFGKRPSTEVPPAPTAEPQSVAPAKALKQDISTTTAPKQVPNKPADPVAPIIKLSRKKAKADKRKAEKPLSAPEEVAIQPTVRMFKRKNNAWSKLFGNRSFTTVLDLNIGDGNRAVEILEAIVDATSPPPKLIAINLFELSVSGISVRQFHQKIRSAGGHPIAIPMALPEGLRRLSETVGTVDLVIYDGNEDDLANPLVAKLLSRVTSHDALVLRRDSAGRWQSNAANLPVRSRQAA